MGRMDGTDFYLYCIHIHTHDTGAPTDRPTDRRTDGRTDPRSTERKDPAARLEDPTRVGGFRGGCLM